MSPSNSISQDHLSSMVSTPGFALQPSLDLSAGDLPTQHACVQPSSKGSHNFSPPGTQQGCFMAQPSSDRISQCALDGVVTLSERLQAESSCSLEQDHFTRPASVSKAITGRNHTASPGTLSNIELGSAEGAAASEDASVVWVEPELPPSTAELRRLTSLQGGLARALTRSSHASISGIANHHRRQPSLTCQASRQASGSQQLLDSLSRESTPAVDFPSSSANTASGLAARAGSSTLASAPIYEEGSGTGLDQDSLPSAWLADATDWIGCLDLPDWAAGLDPQGYVSGRSRAHSGGGQSTDSYLLPFTSHRSSYDVGGVKQVQGGGIAAAGERVGDNQGAAQHAEPSQDASSHGEAASCRSAQSARQGLLEASPGAGTSSETMRAHALVLPRAASTGSRSSPSMLFGHRPRRREVKAPPPTVSIPTEDCGSPNWDDSSCALPSPLTHEQLLAHAMGAQTAWKPAQDTAMTMASRDPAPAITAGNLTPSAVHTTTSISRGSMEAVTQAAVQGLPSSTGTHKPSWMAGFWSFMDTCISAVLLPEIKCRAAGTQINHLRLACSTPASPSTGNHLRARRLRHGSHCWSTGRSLAPAAHSRLTAAPSQGAAHQIRHIRQTSTQSAGEMGCVERAQAAAGMDARTAWWGLQGQTFSDSNRLEARVDSDGSRAAHKATGPR